MWNVMHTSQFLTLFFITLLTLQLTKKTPQQANSKKVSSECIKYEYYD